MRTNANILPYRAVPAVENFLWKEIDEKNFSLILRHILINFRLNAIAFCSDIKQAFLQICLADEHKDAVRFLWSDDEPCVHKRPKLQVYRFNRVNFGVISSPFLLAATIRHHIEKYKHEFPDTVELLDRNFYVDDLISGGNEFEEALHTSRRAKNIMEAAGMDLRKWITNDANLIEQWKKENFNVHPVHETVSLGGNGTKVLGLSWNTNEDYLTTDTKSLLEFVSLDKNTKRFILQAVGKIFDPLGLISPFTVRMKCLLQDLWKEETQWDDPLPTHIEKEWKKWCEELPHLRNLKIPRLVLDSTLLEDDVELHSFCDASKKAYGAAIYLRTKSRNGISVKLVTSKNRVAPLNCVTLPRLELLGALVAARVASKVKKIVNLKRSCLQYHWTDSKIVLFWIKGNKARWKQFVANRVSEITSLTDSHSWYHCAGKENPADFLSRGLSADCLVEGIFNSCPLIPLSSDADNFDVLTPGHFFIGRPITSIPEPNLIDVNENRLSRWEKITKVVQRTWKKWKSDYLNTLQARTKWITEKNDLMIGQMVLIKEDFLPINTWPLGRILEVYHGSDGKV
ncbi:integrase catalytic domain-containing protein [Trichonephila clavipes]|nr:integrase catalytic domain-containing protein [Trichonephila clavipes]